MNTKKMFLYSKLILFDFPKKYTIIYSIIFPVCVCVCEAIAMIWFHQP